VSLIEITPRGSAYRGDSVQLDLPVLETGALARISAPKGIEVAVVLLAGDIEIAGHRAARTDVFDAPATAVYLPPGSTIEVAVNARTELALASTVGAELPAPPDPTPVIVAPNEVVIHERGRPGWQRQVHDIIADTVPAQRLLVGETFNAAGEWSSFPPHKHDGGDGEPALEEVYYYRFDRPDGFGFQGLYELGESASERAVFVRQGSVVGIPRGYHPVCAAPGYRLYYLWALGPRAGTARALALHEDPAHSWLHERATD
jgi:5-deoxy-glucuronate isomerase